MISRMSFPIEHAEFQMVRVFPDGPNGGNPAPIGLGCDGMSGEDLRAVAVKYGHECGFVMATTRQDADFRMRYFVPNHEMEMCGHATVGALWLMRLRGYLAPGSYTIETLSGLVEAEVPEAKDITVSQPQGSTAVLTQEESVEVLKVLGLEETDLAAAEILNASTSRVKTLVPVRSVARLHEIHPDFDRMAAVCSAIDSTGLYPFAVGNAGEFHARQFPRGSGYAEDAATGIAASALSYGLLRYNLVRPHSEVTVRQGEAMGCPSRIQVKLEEKGCRLSGSCILDHSLTVVPA